MKYQIFLHIKDPNYSYSDGDEKNKYAGYLISFKGVFDDVKEGISFIFHKFENLMKFHKIDPISISEHMIVTRIDEIKCEKWHKLFSNQK